MLQQKLKTANGIAVTIKPEPFGRGGEGSVYDIVEPASYKDYCLKIYVESKQNPQQEEKLKFMVKPENIPNLKHDKYRICWPTEVIYNEEGNFVGFIMLKAFPSSELLYKLTASEKVDSSLAQNSEWKMLEYNNDYYSVLVRRMKLCTNLAIPIHSIHSLNKYALVDLKPENILVTVDGKVSVIDLDSIQISENGNLMFPCPVATPEYTPPEGQQSQLSLDNVIDNAPTFSIPKSTSNKLNLNEAIPVTWDRFSFAVIFYQLLVGIHPFTATQHNHLPDCPAVSQKIELGLFPYGRRREYLRIIPRPHLRFNELPENIKALFYKTFDEGLDEPEKRAHASDWGKTLYETIQRIENVLALEKPVVQNETQNPKIQNPKIQNSKNNQNIPPQTKTADTQPQKSKWLLWLFLSGIGIIVFSYFLFDYVEDFAVTLFLIGSLITVVSGIIGLVKLIIKK